MISDQELRNLIRDSVMADAMGLYEAFWVVPDGDVEDDDLKLRKRVPWDRVASVVVDMIKTGDVDFKFVTNGVSKAVVSDAKGIVEDKNNWRPFDVTRGTGYILIDNKRKRP